MACNCSPNSQHLAIRQKQTGFSKQHSGISIQNSVFTILTAVPCSLLPRFYPIDSWIFVTRANTPAIVIPMADTHRKTSQTFPGAIRLSMRL